MLQLLEAVCGGGLFSQAGNTSLLAATLDIKLPGKLPNGQQRNITSWLSGGILSFIVGSKTP